MSKLDCGSGYSSVTADAPSISGQPAPRSLYQESNNAVVCRCDGNELPSCERGTASLEKGGHGAIVGARRQCAELCSAALNSRAGVSSGSFSKPSWANRR